MGSRTIIKGLFLGIMLQGCTTTQSYTKADKDNRSLSVYSTSDKRTAMATADKDSNVNAAIQNLQAKTKKNPRDVTSWLNLANLYVAQNKLDDADDAARKALRLDIKNIEAKKVLAQIAIRRGQYAMAAIILNGVGGEEMRDADVLNMLALVAMSENEPSRAMALFQKALKLDPSNISVRMNLGVSYLKYRMLQAAAVQFERILKVMPENADALMHLAVIKSSRGNYDDAEAIYESILGRKKNNALALYNLAVLQQRKGDFDAALENLKTYLKTSAGKSKETDEAFALIEKIKDLQMQKGKAPTSDEEISALAQQIEDKKSRSASASHGKAKTKSSESTNRPPESSGDAEIDALEKSLIE